MAIELEAKIKVDSHDAVRARLVERGADRLGCVLETNHIFDDAEGTLLAGDRGLRIRTCHRQQGQSPPPTMTYKGPRQPGPLKQREEIQITLDDPDKGRGLLEALGFVEVLCFEKRRESWRLHPCRVELDELPYLGRYVEIEGPSEQEVRRAWESLGLGGPTPIRDSYVHLLVGYCRQRGMSPTAITFQKAAQ